MIDTDFLNGGGTSESGGGTIPDNSITNAKLSQSPANTLKGNNTGSLANAQDLTVTQIKTLLEITGAYIPQGTFDASTGSFPASTKNGWTYIISVAGVIDSIDLQVGDRIYSLIDNASTTTYAGNWFHDDNTGKVTSVNTKDGVVVLNQDDIGDGTTNKQYSQTEKTKLSNIADNATANDTDANLKARANHTGQQTASTISDFDAEVSNNTNVAQNTADRHTHTNKILLDSYTQTEGNLSNAVSHSQATSGNPHSVTKVDVGLGNVDNTTDSNKPVSTLQQTALDGKENANANIQAHISSNANPHSTTKSQVGLGNVDNTSDATKNVLSATKLTTARTINGVSFDGTANIIVADSTKEPFFGKNTAFNKNFGTGATDVTAGNDSRLSDSRKCDNTFDDVTTAKTNLLLNNVPNTDATNLANDTIHELSHQTTQLLQRVIAEK